MEFLLISNWAGWLKYQVAPVWEIFFCWSFMSGEVFELKPWCVPDFFLELEVFFLYKGWWWW